MDDPDDASMLFIEFHIQYSLSKHLFSNLTLLKVTRTVYVTGIPNTATETELIHLFLRSGTIENYEIPEHGFYLPFTYA